MEIWNFFADNHQRRFHQTLLHFIYENYIFLIGLFQARFLFHSMLPTVYFIAQQKAILKYSFSIVIQIFQVFVARRTLVANNNNESKCKWILNLRFTFG